MENQELDYRTTLRMLADWRGRKLLERSRTLGDRLLSYLLPTLWLLALLVAGAAISW